MTNLFVEKLAKLAVIAMVFVTMFISNAIS